MANTQSKSASANKGVTKAPVAVDAKPAAMAPAAPAGAKVEAKPVAAKPAVPAAPKTAEAPKPVVTAKPLPVVAAPVPTTTVTAPKAAAPAPAAIKKENTIMENTIKNATDKTQAQAKAMFADVNDRAKTAMEKSTKAFEEMNAFNKGNIEALVESGKIAAKGIEAMGQEAAEYSRKQFETATAALKGMSGVKSPTDFFKMQSDFMRQSFDSIVAETSKNTEAMLKLVGEVAQPISNRVAIAAEKVKIAA